MKSKTLVIRVTPELYKAIVKVAHDNGLSLADVTRPVLERHFLEGNVPVIGEVVAHKELGNVVVFGPQRDNLRNLLNNVLDDANVTLEEMKHAA